jgi:hypothetical protein
MVVLLVEVTAVIAVIGDQDPTDARFCAMCWRAHFGGFCGPEVGRMIDVGINEAGRCGAEG